MTFVNRRVPQALLICVMLLGAVLAPCAAQAQQRGNVISLGGKDSDEPLEQDWKEDPYGAWTKCFQALKNSPDNAPLRRHDRPDRPNADFTQEQLTDSSFATDEEIKALVVTLPRGHLCMEQLLNLMVPHRPGAVLVLLSHLGGSRDNLTMLIQRKETWGDYANKTKVLDAALAADTIAEQQFFVANIDQMAQLSRLADAQRAQRLAAAAPQDKLAQQRAAAAAQDIDVSTYVGDAEQQLKQLEQAEEARQQAAEAAIAQWEAAYARVYAMAQSYATTRLSR